MGALLAKLTGSGPLVDVEGVQCCNRTEVLSEPSSSSQGSVGTNQTQADWHKRSGEAGRPGPVPWASPMLSLPAR